MIVSVFLKQKHLVKLNLIGVSKERSIPVVDKRFVSLTFADTSNKMKRFFSTNYSDAAFNFALLILRVGTGLLMMMHGYDKLVKFAEYKKDFMRFLGMSQEISLALTVFGEFFCSIFLILGLFTRFAVIPTIIVMSVAFFKAHHADFFGEGEHAMLYLLIYVAILLVGPGRISVDGMIKK